MKILYFSTVNWKWIKQRPHFISQYLSENGYEIDYLSLNPLGKVTVHKKNLGRLKVIDTYVLPFSLKCNAIERVNVRYIKSQLFDSNYDIIIVTSPFHHHYIPDSIRAKTKIIYECMDNMPYFYEGKLRDRMFSDEKRTLDIAEAVITSSDKLTEELQRRFPLKKLNIQTIYNALDIESFSRTPRKIVLQEPNMLYIGTIGQWLDWDVLRQFASNHPGYTIYLIGPCEKKQPLPPNIIWLGTVPHYEVIDYIYSGNVMLLPFKVNELTEAVDPVKMYEYLSMNKPIISAYWRELDKFKCSNLRFYLNYNEFEEETIKAYSEKGSGSMNHAFMDKHHWGKRVQDYINFINFL